MSSHSEHARWNLCRNPFTRSRWAVPLLLLLASPMSRGLAVGGTMLMGTGCAELTTEDCEFARAECIEACAPDDAYCRAVCESDADVCFEEAYRAEERHAERVEAVSDATAACLTIAVCTLETIGDSHQGDGDGDGDGDEWSEPEPEESPQPGPDDWGEDWGEQTADDELPLTQLTDLPEED